MSLEKITEILNKQKMVRGVVQGTNMPRQAIVETLVRRQHQAELQGLMTRLPAEEIGTALETLPVEDANLLWKLVPEHRENEILWEISDARREELVGSREPGFEESQMNAFELVAGRLKQVAITGRRDLTGINPIWIDLLNVTKAERTYLQHSGKGRPSGAQ